MIHCGSRGLGHQVATGIQACTFSMFVAYTVQHHYQIRLPVCNVVCGGSHEMTCSCALYMMVVLYE